MISVVKSEGRQTQPKMEWKKVLQVSFLQALLGILGRICSPLTRSFHLCAAKVIPEGFENSSTGSAFEVFFEQQKENGALF
jgi:hypothetical protein